MSYDLAQGIGLVEYELDMWVNLLQMRFVLESLLSSGDRRFEVWLYERKYSMGGRSGGH